MHNYYTNKLKSSFGILYFPLFIFIVGASLNPGTFGVVPLMTLGLAMIALWLKANKACPTLCKTPKELYFYEAWGALALITGAMISIDSVRYFNSAKMLIRMMLVLWASSVFFVRQTKTKYFYTALLLIAILHLTFAGLGFQVAKEVGGVTSVFRDTVDISSDRMAGLTGNANAMGFAMMAGVWACIMLWRCEIGGFRALALRVLLLACIALLSNSVIQTASRKSLMTIGILIAAWLCWMVPGRFSIKSFCVMCFMIIIVVLIGGVLIQYVMSDTFAGERFQQWFDAGGGSAVAGYKENVRYWMYVDGFKMWLQHPFLGVGLGQFGAYHYSGLYSHSEYMEPLACTGLIGFVIYQGFAFTATMRVVKLLKMRLNEKTSYTLKGMLLFMLLNHYLIGFGGPKWSDIGHCMSILFIGCYCLKLQNALKRGTYEFAFCR